MVPRNKKRVNNDNEGYEVEHSEGSPRSDIVSENTLLGCCSVLAAIWTSTPVLETSSADKMAAPLVRSTLSTLPAKLLAAWPSTPTN